MKFIYLLKIILLLYLSISDSAIECVQIMRTHHSSQESKHLKITQRKFKARAALLKHAAKLGEKFLLRDSKLSQTPAINAQMLKLWVLLKKEAKSDEDKEAIIAQEKVLKDLFASEGAKAGADKAALNNENQYFFAHFKKGKEIFGDL